MEKLNKIDDIINIVSKSLDVDGAVQVTLETILDLIVSRKNLAETGKYLSKVKAELDHLISDHFLSLLDDDSKRVFVELTHVNLGLVKARCKLDHSKKEKENGK